MAEPGLEPRCICLSLILWFLTVAAPTAIQSVLQGVAPRHLDLLRLFRRSQDIARLVTTTVPFALVPVSPPCWVLSWVFQTCQLKAWGHPWTTKAPSLVWLYCFIPNPYSKFALTLSPAQIGTTLMFSVFIKTCRVLHAQIDETVQRFLFHYSFSTCLIFRSVCAAVDLLVSYSLWASAPMGLGRHQSPHPLKRTTLQCILSHKAVLWLLGFTIVWGTDQDGHDGPWSGPSWENDFSRCSSGPKRRGWAQANDFLLNLVVPGPRRGRYGQVSPSCPWLL